MVNVFCNLICRLKIKSSLILTQGKCARKPRQYFNIRENRPDNQWLCFIKKEDYFYGLVQNNA